MVYNRILKGQEGLLSCSLYKNIEVIPGKSNTKRPG